MSLWKPDAAQRRRRRKDMESSGSGWECETPTCKGHPIGLTLQLTLAGETGLHIQQQTLKTNRKAFENIVLLGCSR